MTVVTTGIGQAAFWSNNAQTFSYGLREELPTIRELRNVRLVASSGPPRAMLPTQPVILGASESMSEFYVSSQLPNPY